jgi:signal transduction histidine kinase
LRFNLTLPRFISNNLYLLVLAAWLVTLSFIIDNYWSANSNLQSVTKKMNRYVHNSEKDFIKLFADTAFVNSIRKGAVSTTMAEKLGKKQYYLFAYNRNRQGELAMRFWNTQYVLPDSGIIRSSQETGFAELPNGFYAWNKQDSAGIFAIALIPIKWNYIVTNDYLKNNFVNDPAAGQRYDIFPGESKSGNIRSVHGGRLFYLLKKAKGPNARDNAISIVFRVLASLLVLLFIHLCALYLAQHKRFITSAIFLVSVVLFLRILSYLLPIPFNLRQLELFDPTIYGSSFILRSLGDLLINASLFTWVILFLRTRLNEKKIVLNFSFPYHKWVVLAVGSAIIVAATFIGSNIIRSLIADSQISFDVINFFSLNIYSVVGFVVLCFVAIGYYFLCQAVLFLVKPYFANPFLELYICIAVTGLSALTFGLGDLQGGFAVYTLLWLILFLFLLNNAQVDFLMPRMASSKLIFWLFFFSVSITSIIIIENNQKELRNRQHYAEVLATKTDPASESLLNSMLADFRLNFFSGNFDRLRQAESNRQLKDSLVGNNFSGYTNRYDTRVYSFDAAEQPLFNDDAASFNQLNTILNTQAKPTGKEGLYYYDESFDRFSYISKKIIYDFSGNLLGTLFIQVTPKKVKNEKLYPELFSKGTQSAIENSSLYAFAIYNKNKLISSHNDYPFATSIPKQDFQGKEFNLVKRNQHDELWYNAGAEKYIVMVKENRTSLESITLFSYLFCSFLLLAALFWLVNVFISSRLNPNKLRDYWQLTIRNQIHGIIIFISAASFLVIGAATIFFFIGRYENNNTEKLSQAIQIMKNQVSNSLLGGWQLSDSLIMRENTVVQSVEKSIINIAEIHGVDANIYDLDGDLKFSSLPLPYIKGIVSTKMEPVAYIHLSNQKEVQYFQKEHIGNLHFLSSYVPVLDQDGNAYAYLNIPYFTSESKLQQEIANFLVTIINLNAFIFLIAGIVALFITSRITNSFALIGEQMKKINLGTVNEAIVWTRNDEIGSLVNEYNKMLAKLDQSAAALAKTEREGAWREMAKQVAHEIKNPLTPMKLSMQFLQRSIENDAPGVKELTTSVARTLVEQIDHLSHIASEFSQFANIENARKEILDINESLGSIRQLYEGNEGIRMRWALLDEPAFVHADKTHINRLFTNLIQNALQAVPPGKIPKVEVTESVKDGQLLIRIKDNGEGISEDSKEKIFTPNFTTKTSGTGLGLAMCKRIVEQSNGTIWFETTMEGTTFFILFPLTAD